MARAFDDVLIYAARSLPRRISTGCGHGISPPSRPTPAIIWRGFDAEGYTVELREGHHLAQADMARVIESDVRRDIGGDVQRVAQVHTRYSDETFKHILLPVWTAAYRYRGRAYRFVVNAQTGSVQGERPYSAWKIGFAVVAALIAAALIAYLGQQAP